MCGKKWISHDNRCWLAQWLDQEGAPKHFPKPNFSQKKVMVTIWWCAAYLIHYNVLSPSKTITSEKYTQQADEIHWKLQCLQRCWSTERAQLSMTVPDCTVYNQKLYKLQKLRELGYKVLLHLPYSIWPLANWRPLLQASWQLFAGKMLLQPAGSRTCFPGVCWILKHGFLCSKNKQTYFLLAKMCWLSWFLFWLIKMYLSLIIII